jgi:hypothetical protein
MGKDKFKKRKEARRLIRGEMTKRGILGKEIAVQAGVCEAAVSRYCATSPRIVAALIKAGVPERMFKHAPSPQPSPLKGEGDKDHRQDACATGGA